MSKKSGFTLVELLVVITIIAILSAIGLVAYGIFLKNARDAKRQSDLKLGQSALEQYHADQFFYPSAIDPNLPLTNLTGRPTPSPAPTLKTYLNSIPSDPRPSPYPQYTYTPTPSGCDNSTNKCTKYCLYAAVESTLGVDLVACTNLSDYKYEVTSP